MFMSQVSCLGLQKTHKPDLVTWERELIKLSEPRDRGQTLEPAVWAERRWLPLAPPSDYSPGAQGLILLCPILSDTSSSHSPWSPCLQMAN